MAAPSWLLVLLLEVKSTTITYVVILVLEKILLFVVCTVQFIHVHISWVWGGSRATSTIAMRLPTYNCNGIKLFRYGFQWTAAATSLSIRVIFTVLVIISMLWSVFFLPRVCSCRLIQSSDDASLLLNTMTMLDHRYSFIFWYCRCRRCYYRC